MESEKIRVCHLALGDLWAGAEVQLATLISYLIQHPELTISAVVLNEGRLTEELRKFGIEVSVIDETRFNSLVILKKLIAYLKSHRVDILHTHKYKENVLGSIAAEYVGNARIVRTIHGSSEPFSGFRFAKMGVYSMLDYLVNRFAVSKLVVVSSHLKDKLSRTYSPEKLVLIHNGIQSVNREGNGDQLFPKNQDEFLIGFVGRLMEVKGADYFLKASRIILTRTLEKNIKFVIVGDGPQRSSLEALAANLEIEKNVVFLGHRDDCMELVKRMKIVVLSSLHEGIPMSLLEALSLAKPVVATKVGGIPEVIEDGISGILVPARDENAIAEACVSLFENYDRAIKLGLKGRETIEARFSAKANAEKLANLYLSLVSSTERI